ncbi:MAG: RIP metalloprotease RseP [Gemmatimonadota bacterium]|nr:RIP metalloprotease RseP [Gemmatimonadota bacterium]
MLELLQSTLAIIFVFGVVVFIHELGHFLAAKWVGVYAPRFSIGFGPALWSRKWGETEYILAAIPLGGYVRMASREDEPMAALEGGAERPVELDTVGGSGVKLADENNLTPRAKLPRYYDANAMAPFGPKPVPEHRLFESKSLPKRLLIMIAGVTMNLVLGFVVLTSTYVLYGRAAIATRTVGAVQPVAAAPRLSEQIRPGDVITSVNGAPVRTWDDIILAAVRDSLSPAIRFGMERGEVVIPVGGDGEPTRREVLGALEPALPPVFGGVQDGDPAARAGLEAGDSIVAVAGRPVTTWGELVDAIEPSAGRQIRLDIVRDRERRQIAVTPVARTEADPRADTTRTVGKIGAIPQWPRQFQPVSFAEAVSNGWGETAFITTTVVSTLKQLVTGAVSPRQLGGIIQIASESQAAAKQGLYDLLRFLAIISVNLAVFNLLPIPILDGGQILLNVTESARGRAFSDRTRQYIAYAGLSAIVMLVVFALFNDISRHL